MMSSLVDTIYVGAVPPWLTELVTAGQVPKEALINLSELANILSEQDVSFYYVYLSKTSALTDGLFDQMQSLITSPDNVKWAQAHTDLIETALAQCDLTHFMERASTPVPLSDIRRAFYEPCGLGNTTLLLLGHTTRVYEKSTGYFDAALTELSAVVGYDEAVQSKVLDAFIAATQKG